jgi:3-hydroxyacyl-CoA dehydrogenase/enoyl-CoA hydratase/3-hydroxybutyryl-CoA epimerase
MGYIRLEKDADGIVELIFDQPGKSVNTMGNEYVEAMQAAIAEIESDKDNITGVYLRSGKDSFFGGGDLNLLLEMPTEMPEEEMAEKYQGILDAKRPLRTLETLGVPVAVGINGAALGGGYEIALACHHRIAIDKPGVEVGLPESQLGLMPGAGGVVRMVRKFGLQDAIMYVNQGKKFKAAQALEKGLIDELAKDEADMHAKAKAWIKANPEAKQPWDQDGFKIPGGSPADKKISQGLEGLLYFGPVNVMNATCGNFPAAQAIFACISDVARVDFETAEKIEARYFLKLLLDPVAKNMIRTFFFQLNELNGGKSRPSGIEKQTCKKLGLLGAGQMGAGIAFGAAQVGIEVVLKDISMETAQKGKDYCAKVCEKNKRIDEKQAEEILARITPTDSYDLFSDCDVVIEAVFENRGIKAAVTKDTEAVLPKHGIMATNTSGLPITELAEASVRPENFIGMHFFSPAEKMPLIEIIKGEKTGDEALAKAFDLALQLGKTPIVVNDSPDFFTTRVIGMTVTEGAQMLSDGVNPALIESAAKFAGAPVGPLTAIDEISQDTAYKAAMQKKQDILDAGEEYVEPVTCTVLRRMVEEFGRKGKVHGGGYLDYPEGGKKHMWPGLKDAFAPDGYTELPFQDIQDRLVFCEVIEAVRCLEEGVIEVVGDGNIGSIFGIGFPANTGGVFQCINAYGLPEFVERCDYLADTYGEHFRPPQLLRDKAAKGELFV